MYVGISVEEIRELGRRVPWFQRIGTSIARPHFLLRDDVMCYLSSDLSSLKFSLPHTLGQYIKRKSLLGRATCCMNTYYTNSSFYYMNQDATSAKQPRINVMKSTVDYDVVDGEIKNLSISTVSLPSLPQSFCTRFVDGEYFMCQHGTNVIQIYKAEEGQGLEATFIKQVVVRNHLIKATKTGYRSKIFYMEIRGGELKVTSVDARTSEVKSASKPLPDALEDQTNLRYHCDLGYLWVVIMGELIMINTNTLKFTQFNARLPPNLQHKVFGVTSKGEVLLTEISDTKTFIVMLHLNLPPSVNTADTFIEFEPRSVPNLTTKPNKPSQSNRMKLRFKIQHDGKILFNGRLSLLKTARLCDVVLRSPEIEVPSNCRLFLKYKDEDVAGFRTPNQLEMRNGDLIVGEFRNRDEQRSDELGTDGLHSLIAMSEIVGRGGKDKETRSIHDSRPSEESSDPTNPKDSTDQAKGHIKKDGRSIIDNRIMNEIAWLRGFVETTDPSEATEGEELKQQLEFIKKKYAHLLIFMGRSHLYQ